MKTNRNNDKSNKVQSELKNRPDQQQQNIEMQTAEAVVTPASTAAAASHTHERPLAQVDFEARKENRGLDKQRVLALLRRWIPRAFECAEVVGNWVWVSFPEPQPRRLTAELAQLGFHWNSRRSVWQHPCGVFRGDSTGPQDPREKYTTYHPADQAPA